MSCASTFTKTSPPLTTLTWWSATATGTGGCRRGRTSERTWRKTWARYGFTGMAVHWFFLLISYEAYLVLNCLITTTISERIENSAILFDVN